MAGGNEDRRRFDEELRRMSEDRTVAQLGRGAAAFGEDIQNAARSRTVQDAALPALGVARGLAELLGKGKTDSRFEAGGGTFRPQPQQFDPYDPAVFKTEGALDPNQLQGIIEALKRIGVFQISQPPDTLNY